MNDITVFNFQTHEVRTVIRDGEPWFVAKDVCDVLGLDNITEALRGLDADELTSEILKSGGQGREMRLVSESGLYALIFKSRKPEAKAFRRWVTSEVLPALRKTGAYIVTEETPDTDRWYTAKELAARWSMNLRTVQRQMVKLVEAGRVQVDVPADPRLPHRYLFPDGEAPEACPAAARPLPAQLDLTQLARDFKALKAMAIVAGLRGAAAVLRADEAVQQLRGVSPLELLRIDLEDAEEEEGEP